MRDYGKVFTSFWIDEEGNENRVLASQRLNYSQPGPAKLRDFVMRRDGKKCVICGSDDCLVIDHIVSLKNGGTNHPGNLRCLCSTCNTRKVGLFDAKNAFSGNFVATDNWVAWERDGVIHFGAIFRDRSVSFRLPSDIAEGLSKAIAKLLREGIGQ